MDKHSNHSSSPPSPVSLTLRRRTRDERRRQAEHFALGRPPPSRTLCGSATCPQRCCNVFATSPRFLPVFLLGDNDRSADGIPVPDILTDFAYLASTRMWPSSSSSSPEKKHSEALLRAQSVEAFAASPPVRAAYLDFRGLCDKNGLGFTAESRLRDALAAAMDPFCAVVASLAAADAAHAEQLVHRTLLHGGAQQQPDHGPWTHEACIVRFLLTAELWRRHDGRHMRRRGWAWGGRRRVAEVLSGTLLQYWLMDRERCFERVSCRGGEQCDEVWQEWVDKYPLLGDDDADDDDDEEEEEEEEEGRSEEDKAPVKSPELVPKPLGLIKGLDLAKDVGYVGAVGTAHRGPLWIDTRQRHGVEGLPQH